MQLVRRKPMERKRGHIVSPPTSNYVQPESRMDRFFTKIAGGVAVFAGQPTAFIVAAALKSVERLLARYGPPRPLSRPDRS